MNPMAMTNPIATKNGDAWLVSPKNVYVPFV